MEKTEIEPISVSIELVKDLTLDLAKAEGKDKFYVIHGTIVKLLASQDKNYQRPFVYKKKGWGQIERVESTSDGTPEEGGQRAPRRKKKIRTGEGEEKTGDCWSFRVVDNKILLFWGTTFGIIKKALLRSIGAQNRLRYDAAPLALMKVYPNWLNIGNAPCESQIGNKIPEIVLETRHSQGRDVMVEVFFDYIENRPFSFLMEVDSEAPINEEKFVALMKTLNTLDNIGPSKRGSLQIDQIQQVNVKKEDLATLMKDGLPYNQ